MTKYTRHLAAAFGSAFVSALLLAGAVGPAHMTPAPLAPATAVMA